MTKLLDIPELLIKKGLPFAIYSLPNCSKFKLVFQKNRSVLKFDILNIKDYSGFVIADFDSAKTGEANLIKPDYFLNEEDNITEVYNLLSGLPDNGNLNLKENITISKESYLERTSYLINKLKEKELQKIVFSRVIQKEIKKGLVISSLLRMMRENYKDAFINLFHLPEEGTWFGASPESLFKLESDNVSTVALAGTKVIDEENNNPKWTNKEKEEQYLVTLFIESLLSELSITNYTQTGPITTRAGNLAHLQTKFSIPISSLVEKEGKFIAGLHPTPAVCGLPKAEAYLLIQKAEQHQRRYYTGFLGPWKIDCNDPVAANLFVNLRCAELGENSMNIYVGGGLTSSSIPEDEYMETVHKSKTLLSIVENL